MFKLRKTKWDRYAIKAEIERRGFTLEALGEHLGLAGSSVRLAMRTPYKRVNVAIAKFLGVPVHELWPHWFDRDGDLWPPKYRARFSREMRDSASRESRAVGG